MPKIEQAIPELHVGTLFLVIAGKAVTEDRNPADGDDHGAPEESCEETRLQSRGKKRR